MNSLPQMWNHYHRGEIITNSREKTCQAFWNNCIQCCNAHCSHENSKKRKRKRKKKLEFLKLSIRPWLSAVLRKSIAPFCSNHRSGFLRADLNRLGFCTILFRHVIRWAILIEGPAFIPVRSKHSSLLRVRSFSPLISCEGKREIKLLGLLFKYHA